MKKVLIIFGVFAVVVITSFLLYSKNQEKNSWKYSKDQDLVLDKLENSTVQINDPYLKLKTDVKFKDGVGFVENNNKSVEYQIKDALQPFNIDTQPDLEYPFLYEAKYNDAKKSTYLSISRFLEKKFVAIDTVEIGSPEKIDDIHSENNEVIVEANITDENGDKQKAILTYTFQNNKIVPGIDNIDLNNPPKTKETALPSPTVKATESQNKPSGSAGTIALTFDDGPGKYTPDILQVLKENNVKSTFFMIGQNVQDHPDFVKMVYENGNEVGDHTFTHPQLTKLSHDGQYDEINKTLTTIQGILPQAKIHWFRPPYGAYNADTDLVVQQLDLEKVLWNVDTRDWSGKPAQEIVDSVLSTAKDGSIVLMHDGVANSSETAKALPQIIKALKDKGYNLVTVSELKGK